MGRNNRTNRIIKWLVDLGDVLLLNAIIVAFAHLHWRMMIWEEERLVIFFLVNNIALILGLIQFSTVVHLRKISVVDILRRVVELIIMHTILAYLLMKTLTHTFPVGRIQIEIGIVFAVLLVLAHLIEWRFIKFYRESGGNSRYVVLVGSDSALVDVYRKLKDDPTLGYIILGYYGDEKLSDLDCLGSLQDFKEKLDQPEKLMLGDELYLCVSRMEKRLVTDVSNMCNRQLIRFYYIPLSVESLGLNLKSEFLDDIEIFTTFENPVSNSVNTVIKRISDIFMSIIFLIITAFIFPVIWFFIKRQSPGPVLFRQKRTGLDGKVFTCLKFRSMDVNDDSDIVQATKDDPRKFPFGAFMRRTNIDELPQFWNVLKGDMSVVGPRPHMLKHTEVYSQLIGKYMVRHFVKPGLTGWAQVSGFRGETKELWQMEERVKRDIWYMEHWSVWLDLRIILKTIKLLFAIDKNAY